MTTRVAAMRARARNATWTLALAAVAFNGCAPGADTPATSATRVTNVEPDVTIGLVDGDSDYIFGDIVSVAVDRAGRIYVGDRIGATIRVYDGSGTFLERIAREGRGPGEILGWPADITIGPDEHLYVRDAARVTVFASTMPGGAIDSLTATWNLPRSGNLSATRSGVGRAGEYYYPAYLFFDGQLPRFFYLRFRDGALTGDTLEVPASPALWAHRGATYRGGSIDRRRLEGLSYVPFAPVPVWAVTSDGTLLSSSGRESTLIESSASGDTIRVIRVPADPDRSIPEQERRDSLRALTARLDSLPIPIGEVLYVGEGVSERELPAVLPAIIGIHVASDGLLWVERWPAEGLGNARHYDVVDADGVLQRRLVLAAPLQRDPPPAFGTSFVAGVVRDPETGVERVVRFTIR